MPKGPRGPKGIPDPDFPRSLPRPPRPPRRVGRFVPRRHHPEAHDGHRHTVNDIVAGRRWNSEGHFTGLRQPSSCFRSGPNPGLPQPCSITVPAPTQRDIHNAPHSPILYTILCYIRMLDHIAYVDVTCQMPSRYRMSSRRCGESGFMGPNGPNLL